MINRLSAAFRHGRLGAAMLLAALAWSLAFLGLVLLPGGDPVQAQENRLPLTPPRPTSGVPTADPAPPRLLGEPPPVGTQPFSQPVPVPIREPEPPRFKFTIDPKTPLKDLLPVPPKEKKAAGPLTVEDLARVPEVELQAPLARDLEFKESLKQTAHQLAKINHLNVRGTDRFIEVLRVDRADLAGLPFALGDACRTTGDRSKEFSIAVELVRSSFRLRAPVQGINPPPAPVSTSSADTQDAPRTLLFVSTVQVPPPSPPVERPLAETFWENFQTFCADEDRNRARADRASQEVATLARIAALMQILAPEAASLRLGLVKYLAAVPHAEATRALARLAIFSAEEEVRRAAVEALQVRRERDYTDVLLQGFRYPYPPVARRAGDALVKLERADLAPRLVALLDEPDPRAPTVREADGKKEVVARELVRINHHRNCALCHAPGNTDNVAPETLTAAVPMPGQPLPSPSEGYQRSSSPDVLVRLDVTYLRQDFSMLQPVADAHPWPEMQRYDFLVRTRVLTEDEAAAYREQFARTEPGKPSPYHRAVLAALRELTGKDAAPTPEAWRQLLGLPDPPRGTPN